MKSTTIRCAALAAALTLACGATAAADPEHPMGWTEGVEMTRVAVKDGQIDTISGIVYHQVKSLRAARQLHMTLMIPRTKAKKPAVVYFPGGGFTSADHEKFTEMRYALARAGFVVAAAEYRTVPNRFPALLEDGKAALRYLRAHADELGIDPERIGVLGDSAGGYLVQMLGATSGEKGWDEGDFLEESSDVSAVVSFYGISDLMTIGEGLGEADAKVHASPAVTEALLVHGAAFRDFPGMSILADKEKAMAASPLGHVDGKEPPFFLWHGSNDKLVSPLQSAHMFEALRKAGTDVRYRLVEGAGHGDLVWYQEPVIREVTAWTSARGSPLFFNVSVRLFAFEVFEKGRRGREVVVVELLDGKAEVGEIRVRLIEARENRIFRVNGACDLVGHVKDRAARHAYREIAGHGENLHVGIRLQLPIDFFVRRRGEVEVWADDAHDLEDADLGLSVFHGGEGRFVVFAQKRQSFFQNVHVPFLPWKKTLRRAFTSAVRSVWVG